MRGTSSGMAERSTLSIGITVDSGQNRSMLKRRCAGVIPLQNPYTATAVGAFFGTPFLAFRHAKNANSPLKVSNIAVPSGEMNAAARTSSRTRDAPSSATT